MCYVIGLATGQSARLAGALWPDATSSVIERVGKHGFVQIFLYFEVVIGVAVLLASACVRRLSFIEAFRLGRPASWSHLVVIPALLVVAQLVLTIVRATLTGGHDPADGEPASRAPQRGAAPGASSSTSWSWAEELKDILLKPFSEELIFRGLLFPALAQTGLGFAGAAAVSSVLFGLIHRQYDLAGKIELGLAGLLYCWAVRKTGSIWPGVIAHVARNCIPAVAMLLPE